MHLYGAEHHILVHSDTIDADFHKHSFIQMTIAIETPFEIEVEGQLLNTEGIIINSNVSHRLQESGRPLLLLLMDSTSNIATAFKQYLGKQAYAVFPSEQSKHIGIINLRAIAQCIKTQLPLVKNSESYHLFLEQLMNLFNLDYTQPDVTDPRIKELIQSIKDCTDSDHSIGYYAKQIGLSNSRLSHLFKENTGISLSGYILLHKLQKASYLIFNGHSITDASMIAGFDTPSHFANASKKLLGMTAKDIRKGSVFLQVSSLN
jgi:AraC-like DNA-binding protein